MQNSKNPYRKSKLHAGIAPLGVMLIYARKYQTKIIILLAAVCVGEIFVTGVSYVVKIVIDTISQVQAGERSIDSLYALALGVSGLGFMANLAYRTSGFTAMSFFLDIRRDVRVDFFAYLHAHAHRYFSNHFGGALTNKITTVGRSLDDILGTLAWDILPSFVNIIISLGFLFISNVLIGSITLAIVVVYLVAFYPFLKKFRQMYVLASEAKSASTGKIADVITNIWNLQSHARGDYEESHLVGVFEDESTKGLASWRYMEFIRMAQGIVMAVFIGGIGCLAIWLWSHGKISVGSVVLVFMISLGLLQTVRNLAQRMLDFNEKKGDIQDAINTILVPYEIEVNPVRGENAGISSGSVELRNITFAYDDRGNVFEKLSLMIPHGQKVGFVGVSGSGKSTLVLLLQRFYDIQSGHIFIGGHDIQKIPQDILRQSIAVVPQDPVLFHRSLFENISYGFPNASQEDVIRAAKLAHADEFINLLPE